MAIDYAILVNNKSLVVQALNTQELYDRSEWWSPEELIEKANLVNTISENGSNNIIGGILEKNKK